MENNKYHTPTPWYVSPKSNYIRANSVHGWNIAAMEQEDLKEKDANHIVKCVNAHDELVENLSRIIDRIEESELQHYFPSAYKRAKEALNKVTDNSPIKS